MTDGERVDAALDHLREAGRIERAGSAYRRTERGSSGWLTSPEARADGIRERVGPRLKRLAWPVSVEFDADRERDGAHQRGREGEASDRSDDDWSDAVDRSDAGQERELADGQ